MGWINHWDSTLDCSGVNHWWSLIDGILSLYQQMTSSQGDNFNQSLFKRTKYLGVENVEIRSEELSMSGLKFHQQKLIVGGCNRELWCWTLIAKVKLGCWGWLRSWLWQGSFVFTAEVKCSDSHNGTVVAVMSWLSTLVD